MSAGKIRSFWIEREFFAPPSYHHPKKDLWGKSWFQLVTLDNFFLEWGVRKAFILLCPILKQRILCLNCCSSGREHRQERESTTAQSPRRSPGLSAFKSLALIPELEYGNSATGRNIMSQGNLPLGVAVNISAMTLFQTVVVAVLVCFCSVCFKHLLLVALKIIPKPRLLNPHCFPKGFIFPAPVRNFQHPVRMILMNRFILGV